MPTPTQLPRRIITATAGALLCIPLLAACGSGADEEQRPTPTPVTAITTADPGNGAESTEDSAAASPTEEEAADEAPTTADSPSVVTETTTADSAECYGSIFQSKYSPIFEDGALPVGWLGDGPGSIVADPDTYFDFSVINDQFHTCRPLSYVVVAGTLLGTDGGGGTGGSVMQAVILFDHGRIIAQPAPFGMTRVENTTQSSDTTVDVLYGHAGEATAMGVTEHYAFTFMLTPAGLTGSGELPEHIDGFGRLDLRGFD